LVRCLFLLYSFFLCVAYAAEASFDKKGLLEAVQVRIRIRLLSLVTLRMEKVYFFHIFLYKLGSLKHIIFSLQKQTRTKRLQKAKNVHS
jgi:hypothetical protein